MTGQPSDLAGEPNMEARKDLETRLKLIEENTKVYVAKVCGAIVLVSLRCSTALVCANNNHR